MLASTFCSIPRNCRRSGAGRTPASRWLARFVAAAVFCVAVPAALRAQEGLLPGEAFITKFSGTTTVAGPAGPRTVIDQAGVVGTAIDLRAPGFPADGRHWLNEPHLFSVTAGDVGQVFGVTLDDANPPDIYLTATSAFGLQRNADNSGWLDGMWGPGGGPGTVYRLSAANNYQPEIFAQITLDGRANSGPALGNIAFDRWHHQLFVSDLETGMIHRLNLADGAELGHYDHGVTGRSNFIDAASGVIMSLPPVAFDPTTSAHIADCPSGDFARTPSCWNFADFRRRVWGLDVRRDAGTGQVRLYYAVWGSQGFGNPDWPSAGEDQQNSVWSVAIADDGSFDTSSVRREFFVPEFFRSPEAIARAGISNPVADIAFPRLGNQNVMLLAERGGIRNLGLSAENAFAYPHEARVLRYQLGAGGVWQPVGRYDVGFYDRRNEGPPYMRAGAAGGAAFGMGYNAAGQADPAKPDGFVWMTGDALCSPDGPCLDPATGAHSDTSQVTGLQGENQSAYQEVTPAAAFQPYPAPGPATPSTGPDQSYMIDADIDVDASGTPIPAELARNDATRVGDVVVAEQAAEKQKPDLRVAKRALDPACHAGDNCRFGITITNVGDVPYSGPLAVRDTGGNGSIMVVPPPPDWACQQAFVSVYECSHGPVDLAPGAGISFQVTFQIPTWWSCPVFENCAELTTPDSSEDAHAYNNSACGYGPTAQPGTPYYAPDLQLSKFGLSGQCDWTNNCLFVIRITNVGAAPYSGPLAIRDQISFPGATLAAWSPDPEWTCAPAGGADFGCSHAPVNLAPGDFRELTLRVVAPPPTPGHTQVSNCGWIDWGVAPHDYNPGNEYDCATISRFPPGAPGATAKLAVEKIASPTCDPGAGPGGGWRCYYEVRVNNFGGAPYFGPIDISEATLGPPATLISADPAPWACAPGAGAPTPQTCTHPAIAGGLPPGGGVFVWLYFEVPAAVAPPNGLLNCATVASDYDGDGIAEDHTSCAIALICQAGSNNCPRDLATIKQVTSADPCLPGFPCQFVVGVQNVSDQPYHGPVNVTETPDPGVGPLSLVAAPPGVACFPAGPAFTCSFPGDMPPGSTLPLTVQFTIPPGYAQTSFKNCASVPPGPENVLPFNDQACATAYVPFPDLSPFGGTICKRGADCTLDLGIKNEGLLPFVGSAGVRGTLSPAVPIVSITPQTPGVTCSVTGQGIYECRGQNLNIPPGKSVSWQAVIHIAENFPADQITHTKDMIWPDTRVKDKRPENDRTTSIITIEGPKAPPPPPPPSLARAADLAVTKTANQASCVAGQACAFTVTIRNVGAGAYLGPLQIDDITTPTDTQLVGSGPAPWSCSGANGHYACSRPSTTLPPGATTSLSLSFVTSSRATGRLGNCAAMLWSDTARVMAAQNALNELGFPSGAPDGKVGPQTRGAIQAYQTAVGLPQTGQIDDALLRRLFGAWGVGDANAGNDRSCAAIALETPPQPQISCAGGTVRNNQCVCPQGTERQQVGTYAYRCVVPPPQITCTDGTVRNNECICPPGAERRQVGTNAYRCVFPPPRIVCTGGSVRNNECVCPPATIRQQTGPNAYRCVSILPVLVCQGGTVRNNQCICPSGTARQQFGPNAFRCVRSTPQIQCSGGTVRNNECVCPTGMEARQVGTNAYRCVKSQSTTPSVTCTGGTVRNGQCVCPQGTLRQQTGTNAFRCTPQLQLLVPSAPLTPRLQ